MKKIFLTTLVFMFLSVSFWVMAEKPGNNPVTVSPGSETEAVTVWQSCPTFSWSAVQQAASYRLVVFESPDANVLTYVEMEAMTPPVISKDIPGPALSYTLPAEEKLKTGGQYAWYVRALDASGNALGSWSGGRTFKVEQEVRFVGIEEKLGDILKSYGVSEETITNVLNDMKSGVQEVVVRGTKSTEIIGTPNRSGVQGYEGAYNTYYGLNAGYSVTTGTYDTFIGVNAGYANTTGEENTFLGYSAGYANTTGYSNTFLGSGSGASNTTGRSNTFLGNCSGVTNSTGHFNTFVGDSAGYANTTGYHNTFLGKYAGYTNTTGNFNTFLGYSAGYLNTYGESNTFLGYSAGYTNSTGFWNTFLGYDAGYSNTTGSHNTFLGYDAGYSNTTGNNNTFLGDNTGRSNTTGYYNTFLGYSAGRSNTTGYYNTFVGDRAGYPNTTGYENAFLGNVAGNFNTSGYQNTFLGHAAGSSNTSGNQNTFLGNKAGLYNATGSGNLFLGYSAGYNETGSNKLYIANSNTSSPLIYGEFDNNIVTINGKLGIGTKTPLGAFEIETTGTNAVFTFERTDGALGKFTARPNEVYIGTGSNHNVQIVANNNAVMTLTPDSKVGIGTTTPDYPMELETTGYNAAFTANRTDGASCFINATTSYAQFGAVTDHPVRILVNSAWKMMLNSDGSLSMSNGASCTSGGTWTNASSRSLKENIQTLTSDEAIHTLEGLNPVKYNYKVDKTDKHVGFIAEDVPDLVATADRKGLSPMDVTAVLTKVVQELRRENQEYKKLISDLQERIEKLEKK